MTSKQRVWVWLCVVGVVGCRKEAAPIKPAATAVPSALSSSAPPASASVRAPAPSASAQLPSTAPREPVALDEAGQRTAKAYMMALGRGRKATVAKDYAQADEHFSKCLELVPRDARALAERGYARLLAGNLPEAEADLSLAARLAPTAALELQIVHNQMRVAQKRGDDPAAEALERRKKELKAERRMPSGVSCGFDERDSELVPTRLTSLEEALRLLVEAHAKSAEVERATVSFGGYARGSSEMTDETLRTLAVADKLPDGAWVVATTSTDDLTCGNHAIFSRAGELFVYPALSIGRLARCGREGLAEVRVGGGNGQPWHLYRNTSSSFPGYLCRYDDESVAPCGTVEGKGEGTPEQSYCSWIGTEAQLDVLDPRTFAGIRELGVSAQPGEGMLGEPTHLLDYEWQPREVTVTACGSRRQVPLP